MAPVLPPPLRCVPARRPLREVCAVSKIALRCCFCSLRRSEVELLIASDRGVNICSACVDRCTVLVARRRIKDATAKKKKEPGA